MIHNGNRENIDAREILISRWKMDEIIGIKSTEKPELILFNNEIPALQLIEKHINKNSNIAIHFDVDFDGIASGYIIYNELKRRGVQHELMIINKDKEHGVQKKHVEYINEHKSCELLIIVDSSTDDIDIIKQFKCDVIVIDHHDVKAQQNKGYCNDGEHMFIVVNSTINADDFESNKDELIRLNRETFKNVEKCKGTQKMSCGLVVYEIMRVWYAIRGEQNILEKSRKYQWAAASLYTDQIDLINSRNQWYVQNMNKDRTIDEVLLKIAESIGKYNITLGKSFIQFKLAPLINKAIRANAGSEVLMIITHKPNTACELVKYNSMQENAIEKAVSYISEIDGKFIMLNTENIGVNRTYNGVIASKLCNDNKKSAVVYKMVNGIYKGSFRGAINGFNYKDICFNSSGVKASGHPSAFGFEANSEDEIRIVMEKCINSEPKDEHVNHLISLGNVADDMKGDYHIETLDELRQSKLLVMLAYGNSNVNSSNEINIIASTYDIRLLESNGKYYKYCLLDDMEIISFEALHGKYFSIYAEYSNEIKLYARNL